MSRCNDHWKFRDQHEFKQALLGMIVGDGCLMRAPRAVNYIFIISSVKKEMAEFYSTILNYLTATRYYERQRKDGLDHRIETRSHPVYTKLAAKFYQGIPRKRSYHPVLRNISPLGVYLWYIGDGSYSERMMRLHTEAYSYAEQKAIQRLFIDKFDIQFSIHRTRQYYLLVATGENRNKLYYLLEPFIGLVKEAEYKFPPREEIRSSEVWPEVRKSLPRNYKGQFLPGSRHDLISRETGSL